MIINSFSNKKIILFVLLILIAGCGNQITARVIKDQTKLQTLKEELKILFKRFKECSIEDKSVVYNQNLVEYFELENMLRIAYISTLSALKRCESRGSHYRSDYPSEDKKFEQSILKEINHQN